MNLMIELEPKERNLETTIGLDRTHRGNEGKRN